MRAPRIVSFVLAITALAPAIARAGSLTCGTPQVQNLWSGAGTTGDKFDVVFVAEGFTSSQMALFASNAQTLKNALLGFEPYRTYAKYIRVWQVNSISAQSGADHPGAGVYRDTCFDAQYVDAVGDEPGQGRLITVENWTNLAAAKAKVAGADLVIVIVNDPQYGGCGYLGEGICTTYNGSYTTGVVTHETGHAATSLGDEYCYASESWVWSEPTEPNITTQPSALSTKWSAWVGTPSGGLVGAWQGGDAEYAYGLYRPVNTACHMNDLSYGFCPVCREAVIRMLYSKTNPIVAYRSSATTTNVGTFTASVDEIIPDSSTQVWWQVDGVWTNVSTTGVAAGSAMRYTLTRTFTPGSHRVTSWVGDVTSLLRIGGSSRKPIYTRTWTFTQQ